MAPPPPQNWANAPPYLYRGAQQQQQAAPAAEDESDAKSGGDNRSSLRIGRLLDWMDEDYLRSCFTSSPELVSVVIKRNKDTGQSEGFGFLNFADHETADLVLQSYHGQKMPNTDKDFTLNWAWTTPGKHADHLRVQKLHGIILLVAQKAMDNECRQAMNEMNGAYCSTKPMRVSPATDKMRASPATNKDGCIHDLQLFVGGLDLSVTDEDLKETFSPYGEITDVKVIVGKKYGFVTYLSRINGMVSTMDNPKTLVLSLVGVLRILTCFIVDMHITNSSNHSRPWYSLAAPFSFLPPSSPSSRRRVESIRLLGFDPGVPSAAMAPSSSSNWAMAPPYHYHGPPPQKEQAAPAAEDETGAGSVGFQPRSLWIGGLLNWMDENYLYSCFTRSPELVSVVIKRNKETRQSEGFGFLNFADHATADQILQSYNGQKMPNADRDFKLNWVIRAAPEKPAKPAEDDHAIYVGGLAFDVTDFMLHNVFKNRYPSVTKATVIRDGFVGPSKGYGFVLFGDVNERRQAMTEMDGAYCSTRPMRIRAATGSRTQGTDSDGNWDNKRLFVRGLDLSVTAEDLKKAFSPYGEITNTMLIEGKCCGFITYTSRASAVEALRILDGSQLGDNTMRIFWARRLSNKQDEVNDEYHGHPQGLGPDNGYCPGDLNMHGYKGHGGNAYNQHKQPQQTPVQ
ncbi:hypothetical protein ACQ4PT_002664 [Festuca glaucescens]